MATTLLAINRAERTGRRTVTSETSTVPRTLEMSTLRPARVAAISKCSTPPPTSTRTSTRSPRITGNGRPNRLTRAAFRANFISYIDKLLA